MGNIFYDQHKEEQLFNEGDILFDNTTKTYFMIVDMDNEIYDVLVLKSASQFYSSIEKYSFYMANKYCLKV